MKALQCAVALFLIPLQLLALPAWGSPDYHLVGWVNTVIPGGGQLLLGNYVLAASQAALEGGTFGWGYSLSKRTPLTIDGVPEDYPISQSSIIKKTLTTRYCAKFNTVTKKCAIYQTRTSTSSSSTYDPTPVSATLASGTALLQEFGLKYHMVNVFNSYREAAKAAGESGGQGIDQRSTGELFLDPFTSSNLLNLWVLIPLALSAGYIAYDYSSQIRGGLVAQQPLTSWTNVSIAFNQVGTYSVGSGAPEEMFYRGFIQNEAYHLVPSPFFSIAMSSLAFGLSHSADGRLGAGLTGLYYGFLAHYHHGNLGPGIALHFWSVMLLGVEAYLLNIRAQNVAPPPAVSLSLEF